MLCLVSLTRKINETFALAVIPKLSRTAAPSSNGKQKRGPLLYGPRVKRAGPEADAQGARSAEPREVGNNLAERKAGSAWSGNVSIRNSRLCECKDFNANRTLCSDSLRTRRRTACFPGQIRARGCSAQESVYDDVGWRVTFTCNGLRLPISMATNT